MNNNSTRLRGACLVSRGFFMLIVTLFGLLATIHAQTNLQEIFSFAAPPQIPFSLISSSDGNLYGTSVFDGSNGLARVFQVTPDGVVSTLASFTNASEIYPVSIVEAADGTLYGSTLSSGTWMLRRTEGATIQMVTNAAGAFTALSLIRGRDGNVYAADWDKIVRMESSGDMIPVDTYEWSDNLYPGLLNQDAEGNFYDFSSNDGTNYYGTLFKTAPDNTLTRLYTFDPAVTGFGPTQCLLADDGSFYVVADGSWWPVIVKITPGGEATVLLTDAPDVTEWIQAADGNIYGVGRGSAFRLPEFFRLTTNGQFTSLGYLPAQGQSRIAMGSNGHLYLAFMSDDALPEGRILELTAEGTLVRTIALGTNSFFYGNGMGTGTEPNTTLHLASNGCLYGTSSDQRFNFPSPLDAPAGSLYRINPSGTVSNVLTLVAGTEMPITSPVEGSDGNLYGAGSKLIKIVPNGAATTYDFSSPIPSLPQVLPRVTSTAPFVKGADGALYGAREQWRFTPTNDHPQVIFKVLPDGGFTNLYEFTNELGAVATLVEDGHGALYGIADTATPYFLHGTNYGRFFRLDVQGNYTELLVLDRETSPLISGADGFFYGTQRGNHDRFLYYDIDGVLHDPNVPDRAIKIDTNGVLTELAVFTPETGQMPRGPLMRANDGNFYGTTGSAGTQGAGTIYRLSSTGALASVVEFPDVTWWPGVAGLTQGAEGMLYGVTPAGGRAGRGSIYRLDLGLPPVMTNLFSTVPAGIYNGTLRRPSHRRDVVVGHFAFRVTATGRFYGRVLVNGMICPFEGVFDESYQDTVVARRKRGTPPVLNFSLTKGAKTVEVHGEASIGTWKAKLSGRKTR